MVKRLNAYIPSEEAGISALNILVLVKQVFDYLFKVFFIVAVKKQASSDRECPMCLQRKTFFRLSILNPNLKP